MGTLKQGPWTKEVCSINHSVPIINKYMKYETWQEEKMFIIPGNLSYRIMTVLDHDIIMFPLKFLLIPNFIQQGLGLFFLLKPHTSWNYHKKFAWLFNNRGQHTYIWYDFIESLRWFCTIKNLKCQTIHLYVLTTFTQITGTLLSTNYRLSCVL